MILVTLGTHEQPMRRLVPILTSLSTLRPEMGPFHIQHGTTALPAGWQGEALVGPRELSELMRSADIIITHGGPATIGEARAAGKVPIVVPRQRRFGEHVDDHQLWYARRLDEAREIILVEEALQLIGAIERYSELARAIPAPRAHNSRRAVLRFRQIADAMVADQLSAGVARGYARGRAKPGQSVTGYPKPPIR